VIVIKSCLLVAHCVALLQKTIQYTYTRHFKRPQTTTK